jgi:AraC-like DNA-binding protein
MHSPDLRDGDAEQGIPRGDRARRLQAAQAFLEENLHRDALTPAITATALGISLRQLHLLFEPTATSFSRYLLLRRLQRACALLSDPAGGRIIDIALACGIRSSTVFYRGFHQAFGMNPTEYRNSLRSAK